MENCIKSLKQIDKTHKGLGIIVLLSQLVINSGHSLFAIAPSGFGKKIIINTIKKPNNVLFDLKWDELKLTAMVNRIATVQNQDMLWRFEDFAELKQTHKEFFLSVASKIITDHNFNYEMGTPNKPMPIIIKNCNLMVIIGIQPRIYSEMTDNSMWQSLANDRFLKITCINPLREKEIDKLPFFYPHKLGLDNIKWIPERPYIISQLLKNQISLGRLSSWSRDLLRAYLTYEDYTEYKAKYELEFKQLFGTLLSIFNNLTYTVDIEKPNQISSGALMLLDAISKHNDNVNIDTLVSEFRLFKHHNYTDSEENRQRNIKKYASILITSGLIKKISENPITYTLSDSLTDFYNWYEGLLN